MRLLTPFFNIYGTVTLVGGAIYSAWMFWRKRILPNRVVGNVFILLGALAPALAGLFSRLGLSGYLYVGELLGAILLFIGFIRATSPHREEASREVATDVRPGRPRLPRARIACQPGHRGHILRWHFVARRCELVAAPSVGAVSLLSM